MATANTNAVTNNNNANIKKTATASPASGGDNSAKIAKLEADNKKILASVAKLTQQLADLSAITVHIGDDPPASKTRLWMNTQNFKAYAFDKKEGFWTAAGDQWGTPRSIRKQQMTKKMSDAGDSKQAATNTNRQ